MSTALLLVSHAAGSGRRLSQRLQSASLEHQLTAAGVGMARLVGGKQGAETGSLFE
jgi:hypothetical protein